MRMRLSTERLRWPCSISADIGRIQTRSDRERGLGESHLLSILPDRCSQQPQRGLVALRRRGGLVLSHCRLPRLSGGERRVGCGRRKRSAAVYLGKEVSSRNIQGRRKAEQQQDRNIVPAEFDLAHVLAITHARAGGQCLLGQTALLCGTDARSPPSTCNGVSCGRDGFDDLSRSVTAASLVT